MHLSKPVPPWMTLASLSDLYYRRAVAYRKAGFTALAAEAMRISKECKQ